VHTSRRRGRVRLRRPSSSPSRCDTCDGLPSGAEPFDGFHFRGFGLAQEYTEKLARAGVILSAFADDAGTADRALSPGKRLKSTFALQRVSKHVEAKRRPQDGSRRRRKWRIGTKFTVRVRRLDGQS
jgi:hypothetical protein